MIILLLVTLRLLYLLSLQIFVNTQHCVLVSFIVPRTKSRQRSHVSCLPKRWTKPRRIPFQEELCSKNQGISKQHLASCTRLGVLEVCLLWQAWPYHASDCYTLQAPPDMLLIGSAQRQYLFWGKERATAIEGCHKHYSKPEQTSSSTQ